MRGTTVAIVAAGMLISTGALAQAAPSSSGKLLIDIPNFAAPVAGPNPTVPAPEKRKMVCHTDYQIGSLVKKIRRCGDANMWKRANRANRDMLDVLQQSGLIQQQEGQDASRSGPTVVDGFTPR